MANGEPRDLSKVLIPHGKNGGTLLPTQVVVMFAALLVYVVIEVVKGIGRPGDDSVLVKSIEEQSKAITELVQEQKTYNEQTRLLYPPGLFTEMAKEVRETHEVIVTGERRGATGR